MNLMNHQHPDADEVLPSDVRVALGECTQFSPEVLKVCCFPILCNAPEIETGLTSNPTFTFLKCF